MTKERPKVTRPERKDMDTKTEIAEGSGTPLCSALCKLLADFPDTYRKISDHRWCRVRKVGHGYDVTVEFWDGKAGLGYTRSIVFKQRGKHVTGEEVGTTCVADHRGSLRSQGYCRPFTDVSIALDAVRELIA